MTEMSKMDGKKELDYRKTSREEKRRRNLEKTRNELSVVSEIICSNV
jgi:hypothetical protein